jgi:histidinol-phosphate aminotransferase
MSDSKAAGPRPRPGILEIAAYVGGEHRAPGSNRTIRLASNENPLGASAAAIAAYRAEEGELHRYPDGSAAELRAAIAAAEGLEAGQIVCGAGSDEIIALLMRAYAGPGDEVLYSAHGFLMYPIAAKGVGATPLAVPERDLVADVDALLAAVTQRTRIVFLANPNNPTGSLVAAGEVARLAAGLPPDVLLVLDAAYAEYVAQPDYDAGAALVRRHANVAMVRTFSKIHGLAALRLGWCYAQPPVIDVLNRLRGPFNVSRAALAAGVAAVRDPSHAAASRRLNARLLPWLSRALTELGLEPRPPHGNFLLVRFPRADRTAAAALAHLKADGILVRGMTAYGLPDCLRITVGLEDDCAAVRDSLAGFLA